VIVWDFKKSAVGGELEFRHPVQSIRLNKAMLVVSLEHKTYLYRLRGLEFLKQLDTYSNLNGVLSLSSYLNSSSVFAIPGPEMGRIRVVKCEASAVRPYTPFRATALGGPGMASSEIASVCLSANGELLACCDHQSKYILLFDCSSLGKLKEIKTFFDLASSRSHFRFLRRERKKITALVIALQSLCNRFAISFLSLCNDFVIAM
jgi:hypothetical protein